MAGAALHRARSRDPQRNPTLPSPAIDRFSPARRARRHSAPVVLGAIAATAAIVLTLFAPALRPAPVSADGVPALESVTFYGRGYGHGVGMSQYGARGRALAGQLAPEILVHYYEGTTLGTRSATTNIRVLVLSSFAATATNPLTISGLLGSWSVAGIQATFPAGSTLRLRPTAAKATTWALKVTSATGAVLASKTVSGDVDVRPINGSGVLKLVSKATTSNVYRGFLRLHLTTRASVINHIPLDRYLRGVVPLEMPSTWPAEALKAQAIAARSYALYHRHPTTGVFDVYDDTRSQVYRGKRAETGAGNTAVTATAGTVLLNGTAIVNALFHSSDGGWTENNENVFVSQTGSIVAGPVSYLRGSSDRAPDGTSYDAASPYASWRTKTYPIASFSAMLATDQRTAVGTVTGIDLDRRGVSGRVISVTLTGDLGAKTVSGDVFRAVFNAARPAADPSIRGTLVDLAPIG